MDEYDAEQTIKQFAEAIQSGNGNGAGGQWCEWAKQILKPKRDVMAPLRRLIRQTCELATGTGDRSYRRPSRRSNADFVLPSNVCPIPRICILVDTSGSMAQRDISLALGAVKSVLDGFRIRDGITFITGDTRVQLVQTKLGNVNRCQFKGGGGTSMVKPIKHTVEMKPKPQLLIVCSDGEMSESDWGPDPKIPTLAVLTRQQPSYYTTPQWLYVANIG